jgi:hypothetical protein
MRCRTTAKLCVVGSIPSLATTSNFLKRNGFRYHPRTIGNWVGDETRGGHLVAFKRGVTATPKPVGRLSTAAPSRSPPVFFAGP